MAKLSTAARNKLPASAFAGPGRSYPVNDKAHARAALRLIGHAPASAQPRIRARAHAMLGHADGGPVVSSDSLGPPGPDPRHPDLAAKPSWDLNTEKDALVGRIGAGTATTEDYERLGVVYDQLVGRTKAMGPDVATSPLGALYGRANPYTDGTIARRNAYSGAVKAATGVARSLFPGAMAVSSGIDELNEPGTQHYLDDPQVSTANKVRQVGGAGLRALGGFVGGGVGGTLGATAGAASGLLMGPAAPVAAPIGAAAGSLSGSQYGAQRGRMVADYAADSLGLNPSKSYHLMAPQGQANGGRVGLRRR